jgi:hypothetical protein
MGKDRFYRRFPGAGESDVATNGLIESWQERDTQPNDQTTAIPAIDERAKGCLAEPQQRTR